MVCHDVVIHRRHHSITRSVRTLLSHWNSKYTMAFCAYAKLNSLCLVSTDGCGRTGNRGGRKCVVVVRAASSSSTSYEEGQLERPKWTGETPLSRLVGALISFKPLYSVLKLGARQVLIRSLSLSLSLYTFFLDNLGVRANLWAARLILRVVYL